MGTRIRIPAAAVAFFAAAVCSGGGARPVASRPPRAQVPRGIYLPHIAEHPATPPTRTLPPAEAAAALERDWLFQAMGEPELRALGDPDFPCIEELPIRPRVATAPVVERP